MVNEYSIARLLLCLKPVRTAGDSLCVPHPFPTPATQASASPSVTVEIIALSTPPPFV